MMPPMTFRFPIFDGSDNSVRPLEIAVPAGWLHNPELSAVRVEGAPLLEPSGSSILPILFQNTVNLHSVFLSPERFGLELPTSSSSSHDALFHPPFEAPASPMSTASTGVEEHDPCVDHQEL